MGDYQNEFEIGVTKQLGIITDLLERLANASDDTKQIIEKAVLDKTKDLIIKPEAWSNRNPTNGPLINFLRENADRTLSSILNDGVIKGNPPEQPKPEPSMTWGEKSTILSRVQELMFTHGTLGVKITDEDIQKLRTPQEREVAKSIKEFQENSKEYEGPFDGAPTVVNIYYRQSTTMIHGSFYELITCHVLMSNGQLHTGEDTYNPDSSISGNRTMSLRKAYENAMDHAKAIILTPEPK